MKINSINIYAFGSGSIIVTLGNESSVSLSLREEECHEFVALGQKIFDRRQTELIEAVAQPFPSLVAPDIIDAEILDEDAAL